MDYKTLYRPQWTCGRYDQKTHSAIFYNLVSGFVYFYTEISADVIGVILNNERNKKFSIDDLVSITGISEDSIQPFLEDLCNYGLITDRIPNDDDIARYRSICSSWRKQHTQGDHKTTKEKLPFEFSTSEVQYSERVGGITSVMFEMTYRCSEKCIHCYNPGATRNDNEKSQRGSRAEMSLEDYKRIIDELYAEGLFKVCLSGGDPFSNKYIWEVLDYLYQKEIAVDIFTNGISIVDKVDKLASYFPRLVGISIYSGNADEHDYITRIKGSWDKSIKVIEQLSNLGVPMNLKCCIMRPNIKHYYQVADICKKYGAQPQFEISVTDSVEGDKCVSRYLRLTPEMYEVVLRDDNLKLYVGKEAPNYGGYPRKMNVNGCGAGCNSYCITPEGNLIPCCAFHLEFGNLKDKSLKEVVKDNDILTSWQSATLEEYEECGQYDYCNYCNLCPGCNHSEHQDYRKSSENCCYLAKIRYNLAQKMMNGYDPLEGMTIREKLYSLPNFKPMYLQREYKK